MFRACGHEFFFTNALQASATRIMVDGGSWMVWSIIEIMVSSSLEFNQDAINAKRISDNFVYKFVHFGTRSVF